MNLLPFENIEITSPLTKHQVINTVRRNIAWTKDLGMTFTRNTVQTFEGFTDDEGFKIRRILQGGINSFIPIVTGVVIDGDASGSRILLKLRLHKAVVIFGILMTLFSGFLLYTSLFNGVESLPTAQDYIMELSIDEELKEKILKDIDEPERQESSFLTSFIFFISPYLICTFFFNYEARIVKSKLDSILYLKH